MMRRPKTASRAVLSVLLLAGLALAGCASEETPTQAGSVGGTTTTTAPAPSNTTSEEPEPTGTTGPEPTGGEVTNRPPTAELTADATEAEAPADINFSIDAADEDGDGLTWTLDADGDGEADTEGTEANLPFTFTFTFDTAGDYTALLTVSDGEDEVEEALEIVITEVDVGDAGTEFPVTKEMASALMCFSQECYGSGADMCLGFAVTGENGFDCVWFELTPDFAGHAFIVSSDIGVDTGVEFRSDCTSGSASVEIVDATIGHDEGVVPDGAGCIVIWEYFVPQSTISVTFS